MPPPPYRADQIGSLIRSQYLQDARPGFKEIVEAIMATGQMPVQSTVEKEAIKQKAKAAAQKAIPEVISEQMKRGIFPLSSGEYERENFFAGFFEVLDGLEMRFAVWSEFRTGFPTNRPLRNMPLTGREVAVATDKIKHNKSAFLEDWLYVRSLLPEERWKDVKMTMSPPAWWLFQLKEGNYYDEGVYDSPREYLEDMSKAVKQEILDLYGAGCRFIQIDDPNLTFFCDSEWMEVQAQEGADMDALLDLCIKSHNDVLADLPSDLRIGVHLCRGNFTNGVFMATGAYNRIAAKLFQELNYKLYYLEYDSDRAGDFTALQHLPIDKAAVLGVVTTKYAELENLDALKARVMNAAEVIAQGQGRTKEDALRDNLAVSPQCGFASVADGHGVEMTEEVQWRKLELLKRLAKDIWPLDMGR